MSEKIIADNFEISNLIGKGAFGEIYISKNKRDKNDVIIKKEIKKSEKICQLKIESKVYKSLLNISSNDISGKNNISQDEVQGIPYFYGMGELSDSYYLILELLGLDLNQLFNFCKNKFSITTTCLIALQMLNRIENIHKHFFIHRDIKPENFLIGSKEKSNIIFLIDFGLSKKYKDSKTNQHIPYKEGNNLTGTLRYMSINNHFGIEQSRRDDLESIGYVLIYFLKGNLPWQGNKGKDKIKKIKEKKYQTTTEILCNGLPEEMIYYLNYCKKLRFEDKPNYEYLTNLFVKLLEKEGNKTKFDWNIDNKEQEMWDVYNKKIKGESNNNNNEKNGVSEKTNENNPENIPENDNISSNKNDKKSSECSDDTLKEEFDGNQLKINKDNKEEVNKQLKNILSNTKKEEEIDKYITKLLKKKRQEDQNGNNNKEMNNNKETNKEEKKENKKAKKKKKKKEEVESISSDSSESIQPIGTTGKIKLKDSLDIPNPDGKDRRKSVLRQSPEEIEKKLKEMAKLLDKDKNSVLIKNTYRNSKMISLDDLKKIQEMQGLNVNNNTDKNKHIEEEAKNNNNAVKEEKKESNNVSHGNFGTPHKKKPKRPRGSVSFKFDANLDIIAGTKLEEEKKKKEEEEKKKKEEDKNSLGEGINVDNLDDENDINVSKQYFVKISKEPISKKYIILSDLGHGSYGQVKKVKHNQLNEVRAMKMTSKKTSTSKIEIDILRKISHPNITNIFEIYEDSKKYYIMMEFLSGGELFEAITSAGSFNEISAAKIMKQLLNAINYLHSTFIVHRDLKPENIMLTSQPKDGFFQIKLIDFGAATTFEKGKKINKFIGTCYYIAPEVLNENYDEKCDVWSCGVIFYILLCGYPPFNGKTNLDIYHNIKKKNPVFQGEEWDSISKDAIDLIKNMLNKNPTKRFSAEKCLQHKWFSILEDEKNTSNFQNIQRGAITHLAQFVQENRLKKAVLQFISSQFDIQKEEIDLKEIFKSLDTSGKGQLSRELFKKKLVELYGENDAKEYSDKIFSNLDLDGSGLISYDEFLSAMISSKKIVTDERLSTAFKMFDKDNSGKLSVQEIINVFGGDEESWKKVISEIDLNQDGEVDFNEFKIMMVNADKNVGIRNNINHRTVTKPKDIDKD